MRKGTYMKKALLYLALASALGGAGISAQDFSGSLEARLGWNWKNANLLPLTQVFSGAIDGKVGDQDLPAAQYSAKLELAYDPATAATSLDLGETWVKLFVGPFDISAGNQVVAYDRSRSGALTLTGTYETGGLGGKLDGSVVDHLASQGSLTYDRRHRELYAVNATAAMVAAPATEARRVRFLMGDLPSGLSSLTPGESQSAGGRYIQRS